jgi:hypothetical protein
LEEAGWTRPDVLFGVVVVVGLVLFAARRGALYDLRKENEELRNRSGSEAVARADVEEGQGKVEEALSVEESRELLQLRGQVQPLRREIQELSNRVERLARAPTNPLSAGEQMAKAKALEQNAKRTQVTVSFLQSQPVMRARERGSALGGRIKEFIEANDGNLPADLSMVSDPGRASPGERVDDEFELIRSGAVAPDERAHTFVARQKEPMLMPDGRGTRLYVLADGNIMFGTLGPDQNWKRWEERTEDRLAAKQAPHP